MAFIVQSIIFKQLIKSEGYSTFGTTLISKFTCSSRIFQALCFTIVGKFSSTYFLFRRFTAKCFQSIIVIIIVIIIICINIITFAYWLWSFFWRFDGTSWTTNLKFSTFLIDFRQEFLKNSGLMQQNSNRHKIAR